MCDVWCMMYDVCVMCDVWCMMYDVWCVMCDVYRVDLYCKDCMNLSLCVWICPCVYESVLLCVLNLCSSLVVHCVVVVLFCCCFVLFSCFPFLSISLPLSPTPLPLPTYLPNLWAIGNPIPFLVCVCCCVLLLLLASDQALLCCCSVLCCLVVVLFPYLSSSFSFTLPTYLPTPLPLPTYLPNLCSSLVVRSYSGSHRIKLLLGRFVWQAVEGLRCRGGLYVLIYIYMCV